MKKLLLIAILILTVTLLGAYADEDAGIEEQTFVCNEVKENEQADPEPRLCEPPLPDETGNVPFEPVKTEDEIEAVCGEPPLPEETVEETEEICGEPPIVPENDVPEYETVAAPEREEIVGPEDDGSEPPQGYKTEEAEHTEDNEPEEPEIPEEEEVPCLPERPVPEFDFPTDDGNGPNIPEPEFKPFDFPNYEPGEDGYPLFEVDEQTILENGFMICIGDADLPEGTIIIDLEDLDPKSFGIINEMIEERYGDSLETKIGAELIKVVIPFTGTVDMVSEFIDPKYEAYEYCYFHKGCKLVLSVTCDVLGCIEPFGFAEGLNMAGQLLIDTVADALEGVGDAAVEAAETVCKAASNAYDVIADGVSDFLAWAFRF